MSYNYAIVTFGRFKGQLCAIEGSGPYYTIYVHKRRFGETVKVKEVLHFTNLRYLSDKEYFKRKLMGK